MNEQRDAVVAGRTCVAGSGAPVGSRGSSGAFSFGLFAGPPKSSGGSRLGGFAPAGTAALATKSAAVSQPARRRFNDQWGGTPRHRLVQLAHAQHAQDAGLADATAQNSLHLLQKSRRGVSGGLCLQTGQDGVR